MKKLIYLAFALLLMSATSMKAQVAIGTENPDLNPHTGAILDLGQVKNKDLGLLLPTVPLTSASLWEPVVGAAIEGMMVFNDSPSTENGLEGKGVYVWVNGSWNKMKTPPQPLTQDNPDVATICYGATAAFTLAAATGGSGAITYNWQQSTDNSNWGDAEGTRNTQNYTTPALTSNMYYRRQATATVSGGTINSTGALVTVNSAFIQDNPAAVTICYNTTTTFTLDAASGGSGNITYNWQQSTDNSNWGDATGTHNTQDYTTPALTSNMYYRRQATAATCGGTIESTGALVTVNPVFAQGNPTATTICSGETAIFNLPPATGGVGAITYNWQQSANGTSGWGDATGTHNTQNYETPALTSNMYYRRQAFSEKCGTIASTGALVTAISFSQQNPANATVCLGDTKTITLTAATAGAGSGNIYYNWQESQTGADDSWVDATGTHDTQNYTTPALTSDMYYRRQATCTCGTITSQPAQMSIDSSYGAVVSATSGIEYTTYSYPSNLGIWTENVKEEGASMKTYDGHGEGARGYYYTWAKAFAACTDIGSGWSLPTETEWNNLVKFVNESLASDCGKKFMVRGNVLAGYYYIDGAQKWWHWDEYGEMWGASVDSQYARVVVSYNVPTMYGPSGTWTGFYRTVRCVKSN